MRTHRMKSRVGILNMLLKNTKCYCNGIYYKVDRWLNKISRVKEKENEIDKHTKYARLSVSF